MPFMHLKKAESFKRLPAIAPHAGTNQHHFGASALLALYISAHGGQLCLPAILQTGCL